MTDEHTSSGETQPGGYDDDRLLACALGLEGDPDLLAAADADAELRARLAAMRVDVDAVGAQVRAAVPAPDESYADLSGDRWSGLSDFFQAPTGKPRRERRLWRVLAPVAAMLVLAVVVGIVAVNGGGQMTGSDSGAGVEAARSVDEEPLSGQSRGDDASSPEALPQTAAARLAEQLDHFAVVVLAQARAATGALQRFAVVRIFKGDAPQVVELDVDDDPARAGRLHLLMLDPVEDGGGDLYSPQPVPSLVTSTKDDLGYGEPMAVSYTYEGKPAMAREFDAGTDPDTISLPIP